VQWPGTDRNRAIVVAYFVRQLFAGIFPADSSEYDKLAESIERLTLNDNSVAIQRETRCALRYETCLPRAIQLTVRVAQM